MPNTKSAIKRLKQSNRRRLANRIARKVIRTYNKRALAALTAKDFDKAVADFKIVIAKIDKAGVRRILHPNTAARRKSRVTREFNALMAKAKA